MLVSLYQNDPEFGATEENLDEILEMTEDESFDLLVLPELFASGYLFESKGEARELGSKAGKGKVFDALTDLASERDAMIVFGFPEVDGDKIFNSAAALYPDGNFRIYRKTHLFSTEKEIFDPGDTGFFVFDFRGTRVGIIICFDWIYPESVRALALRGAQIVCHPSNLVLPHCPAAMITRALENRVFTVTADRIGEENRAGNNLRFIGQSRIVAPDGKVLGELGDDRPGLITAEIEPEVSDNKRITPMNNLLEDRRPEFYA